MTDAVDAPSTPEPPFAGVITSSRELRARYRRPVKEVAEKKLDHIPPWARAMIEAARFVFIATADADGRSTVSPKGGRDGFVTVLDEHRLAIPDYPGNNLIDSLQNIVVSGSIGLIFVIPGRSETLRVDGDAYVSTDPGLLEACRPAAKRPPKTAIGVRVRSVFFHCPSSFQRARLWDSQSWRGDVAQPFDSFIRAVLPPEELPDWAELRPTPESIDDDR